MFKPKVLSARPSTFESVLGEGLAWKALLDLQGRQDRRKRTRQNRGRVRCYDR